MGQNTKPVQGTSPYKTQTIAYLHSVIHILYFSLAKSTSTLKQDSEPKLIRNIVSYCRGYGVFIPQYEKCLYASLQILLTINETSSWV